MAVLAMTGGAGNDIYYVDNASDTTTELAGGGVDETRTTLASYTLSTNLEKLTYIGGGNFNGTGNTSDNVITGGIGNDDLSGLAGSDTLNGGDGNDTLKGGAGADILNGGNGIDIASYAGATTGVTADLANAANNTGDAAGDIYSSIETIFGGAGNDIIRGDAGDNVLHGGTASSSGNDTLEGKAGNDHMDGGDGDDLLDGGEGADILQGTRGNDTLTGGTQSDTFEFYANFGNDTITDFVAGGGSVDIIEFHDSLFADFAAVQAASTQVGSNVLITFDASNSVTLQNVTLANLHQDDFAFL